MFNKIIFLMKIKKKWKPHWLKGETIRVDLTETIHRVKHLQCGSKCKQRRKSVCSWLFYQEIFKKQYFMLCNERKLSDKLNPNYTPCFLHLAKSSSLPLMTLDHGAKPCNLLSNLSIFSFLFFVNCFHCHGFFMPN